MLTLQGALSVPGARGERTSRSFDKPGADTGAVKSPVGIGAPVTARTRPESLLLITDAHSSALILHAFTMARACSGGWGEAGASEVAQVADPTRLTGAAACFTHPTGAGRALQLT